MEKYTKLDIQLNKILIDVYLAGKEWSPLPVDVIVDEAIARIKQLFPPNNGLHATGPAAPITQDVSINDESTGA